MKNRLILWLLIAGMTLSVCLLGACHKEKEETSLPPLATEGIPENEAVTSTVVVGGCTVTVHRTYAEIVGYEGTDTVLTLPSSAAGVPIKKIAEGAFQKNEKITKVILPSGVLLIDRFAFDGCKKLTEVVLGDRLEVIGDYAFRDSALTSVTFPDTLVTIGRYSFYRTQIGSLVLPDSVSTLGKYAFYGCEQLSSLTLGARLSEIEENAFYCCTSLTEVILPETVTALSAYAFSSCTSLTTVFVPSSVTKIGAGVFADCPSLTVYTPNGSTMMKEATRSGYPCLACEEPSDLPAKGGDL